MDPVSLSRGCIAAICSGLAESTKPVVQIVDLKPLQTAHNNKERFRMLLSDGEHSQPAMLATQMNGVVKSGGLQKGSVVQLNEFICNLIQNRKIITVLSLDIIVESCNIIGEPKGYDGGPGRASIAAQTSPADQPDFAARNPRPHSNSLTGSPIADQFTTDGVRLNPMTKTSPYGQSSVGGSNPSQNVANDARGHDDPHQNSAQVQRFSNPGSAEGSHLPGNANRLAAWSPYRQSLPQLYAIMYENGGPNVKNEAPARIISIAALNPYQGRWTIKARVTSKGELRHYNNPRGEGKVFSFDLLDSDGGEIRATCFNTVADQFYHQIEVGKLYLISKGSLKSARKNFNHLNNDYEMFLESTSTVEPYFEEDDSIPRQQFNFRPINEIESMEANSMADVVGIVSSINPASSVVTKSGTGTQKRSLHMMDMSGHSVELTLWGNFCNSEGQQLQDKCDSGVFPVLAVKSGRVSDFSGKSLGTISSSQLFIDPDFPEAHRLKEWYKREGKNSPTLSISRGTSTMGRAEIRKTVSQIKDEGLGGSDKPDWITVKSTVTFIKVDNFCYTACPLMIGDRQCNKKVINNGDGNWRCERCDKCVQDCDYRYLLQLQVQDHTGLTWVTAFQESGEDIMGIPAKELYSLRFEEQDDATFSEVIRGVLFNEYLFKLKVKEEVFSDEQRLKLTVVKAEKVNPSLESRYVLDSIEKVLGEDSSVVSGRRGNLFSDSGLSNVGYGGVEFNHGASVVHGPGQPSLGSFVDRPAARSRSTVDGGRTSNDCYKCHQPGHWARDCPGGASASSNCYKCNQPGHWARDCPGVNVSPSPHASRGGGTGRYGHSSQQELSGF